MQKDDADFESIAFCVWSRYPKCEITLEYEQLDWIKNENDLFPLDYDNYEFAPAKVQHYMRFLYRVYKMKQLYGKMFCVSEKNSEEISKITKFFEEGINNGNFAMTKPGMKSGIKSIGERA